MRGKGHSAKAAAKGFIAVKSRLHRAIMAIPAVVGVAGPMIANAEEHEGTLRAGILDFYPFGYEDQNQQTQGLSVDLFETILEYAGLSLESELLPVARALSAAQRGEVDLLYSYKAEDMISGVEFLGKVGCLTSMVVPRSDVTITSLEDLSDLRVGFIAAGYFAVRFAATYPMTGVPLPSNETMLRMLVRGNVDAIVLNDGVLFSYFQRDRTDAKLPENWRDFIGMPLILETLETHISISKSSPKYHHRDALRRAVERVASEGLVEEIYRRYGVPHGGTCDPLEVRRAVQ